MKLEYSNLWCSYADVYVITTNSYVNNYSELVMGRGAAKQAKLLFPELPVLAGRKILNTCGHLGIYGFELIGIIGLFQVKKHFKDFADLDLIKYAALKLTLYIAQYPKKLDIHMNYPAIGYGGLRRDQVEPVISNILPDSVTVHMYKELI